MGKGTSPTDDAAILPNIPQHGHGHASSPYQQPNQQSPGQPACQVPVMTSFSGQHNLGINAHPIFPPRVLAGNNLFQGASLLMLFLSSMAFKRPVCIGPSNAFVSTSKCRQCPC
jgi:hypothetical protein